MKLGRFIKAPGETKRYSIDYTNWLDSGETVTSVTYAVSDAALVVSNTSINPSGVLAVFYVSAGTSGVVYEVTVTATTSASQVKQDVVQYTIQDPA